MPFKISRVWCRKFQLLICSWMDKRQRLRVQHWTLKSISITRSIQNVFHQWMSQRIGMDSDLMRSACHRLCFHQSRFRIPFNDPESGLRGFPVFVIHHCAMLVSHIGAQRMFRDFLLPFRIPFQDRVICLLRVMIFKLDVQARSVSASRAKTITPLVILSRR